MILSWMLYSTLIALLLGGAAAILETPVHQRGCPVRGLWMTAIAGSLLIPVASRFLFTAGVGRQSSLADGGIASRRSAGQAGFDWSEVVPFRFESAASPEVDVWLVGLWITGSLLASVAVLTMHATVLRRSRQWQPSVLDGTEIWVSSDTGPAVVGFVRPRIVIPGWVLALGPRERELVLLHEKEHVRAGDQRVLLAGLLAVLALPWNAPLWWQLRRLRQAVEIDCDRRVLARGLAPLTYSRLLVEVTERGVPHRFVVAGLAESALFLEKRIRLMLANKPGWGSLRSGTAALLASILVAAACSVDRPADPSIADVTLWVAPGLYRLGSSDSDPLPVDELRGALEAALATSAVPRTLKVRNLGDESLGYDFILARIAACEAGVRRLEYDLDIRAGNSTSGTPESVRGIEQLGPPCVPGSQQPDSAEVDVANRETPSIDQ